MELSYTQNLEDYHLSLAFSGQASGTYIYVGAGHPVGATGVRVETGEDLSAALARECWDLVISDHELPGFSSGEALAIVRALPAPVWAIRTTVLTLMAAGMLLLVVGAGHQH